MNNKQRFDINQLIKELGLLDDFICCSEYYSTSGEAAEIDDICKYEHDELDYKQDWDRELIATYGQEGERGRAQSLIRNYELLFNERMKELKELAEKM